MTRLKSRSLTRLIKHRHPVAELTHLPRTERAQLPSPVRLPAESEGPQGELENCAEELVAIERLTVGQAFHKTVQSAS